MAATATARAQVSDGLNEASGVNLTADEGFGARRTGMGIGFPAFQRDADAAVNSPAGMNDVDDFTFSTAHAEKFGRAQFDDFAFILPFDVGSTLGLGLSRFGVNDIELRPEGSDPFQTKPQGLQFPGKGMPDYLDFAYFSFVIGMTSQVSDVTIASREIRRWALLHGLTAFGFNAAILAVSVNVISGIFSPGG